MTSPLVRRPGWIAVTACLAAGLVGLVGASPAAADRTLGQGPLEEVLAAAEIYHDACTTRANRLTVGELAALVLAPTFPETGAPSTVAPSPMTLSRYDTQDALHSYGNPANYPRAFWHPGVGAWQWDDASLRGLPAFERINSSFIAEYTTAVIAERWCRDPRFQTVWGPWYGCSGGTCRAIYDQLVDGAGRLVDVTIDTQVSRRGGMASHTCTLGTTDTFRCWFVDPGRAQGYAGFAQPTWGRSPVTTPFLVFRTPGREQRHWLRSDSGYPRDIRASLPLGRNSRDALSWATGSDLCDVTRGVGRCDPLPPPGFDLDVHAISGDYVPLAGDFDGDGVDDILWYGPGAAADSLWLGGVDDPDRRSIDIRGVYDPLVGDFDGDGHDDILWYGPGRARDSAWFGADGGFDIVSVNVRGNYRPTTGDFGGDGRDDILWYGPGGAPDSLWTGRRNRGFGYVDVTVRGTYRPIAGDFDGDGRDDVFWYGRGSGSDSLWYGRPRGAFAHGDVSVGGDFDPVTGDLNGDGRDDILWYAAGPRSDAVWWGGNRDFTPQRPAPSIDGEFRPVTGDFDRGGSDDVFFHRPGSPYDATWSWTG